MYKLYDDIYIYILRDIIPFMIPSDRLSILSYYMYILFLGRGQAW